MPLHPNSWKQTNVVNMANFTHKTNQPSGITDHMYMFAHKGEEKPALLGEELGDNTTAPAIAAITCVFALFTISVTVIVLVSCSKKNTVFAMQKSEEEDIDDGYELESVTDDVSLTDLEDEDEVMCAVQSKAFIKSKKRKRPMSNASFQEISETGSGENYQTQKTKSPHNCNNNTQRGSNKKVDFHKVLKKQTEVRYSDDNVTLNVMAKPYPQNVSHEKGSARMKTSWSPAGPTTTLMPSVSRSQSYQSNLPAACMLTVLPKSRTMEGEDFSSIK